MSLNIGDNFSYLGKKFLDNRQSFPTLVDMKNCTDVPDGFITYCQETDERYEYKSSNVTDDVTGQWRIMETNGGGGTSAVIQNEEPEDNTVIWFDPEEDEEEPKDPYISELKLIIKTMTEKIQALTTKVEYLESVVGKGEGGGTSNNSNCILLEDGTPLLLEDGGVIYLEG